VIVIALSVDGDDQEIKHCKVMISSCDTEHIGIGACFDTCILLMRDDCPRSQPYKRMSKNKDVSLPIQPVVRGDSERSILRGAVMDIAKRFNVDKSCQDI
jgi:hypothetical protein